MKDLSLLYRFFEGRASMEEMKQVKAWCDADSRNQRILLRERKLYDAMILTSPAVRDRQAEKTSRKLTVFREWMKIAAVVVLSVGVTMFLSEYLEKRESAELNELAMQTVTVPAGQRVNLTLPDGTNIWLNAKSSLTYPVKFMEGNREVTLDGEGFFEVSKQHGVPFVVHTSKLDIRVLGTQFNVEAYSSNNEFKASLLEGRIDLYELNGEKPLMEMKPNYCVELQGNALQTRPIEDYNAFRWKDGLYCFKNRSFTEVIDDLEKYFDIKINIAKTSPALEVSLTGKFRLTDGLDYILQVLQSDVHFTYRRDVDKNQIIIR